MNLRNALLAAAIVAAPVAMAPASVQAQPLNGVYVGAGAGVNWLTDTNIRAPGTGKIKSDIGVVGLGSIGYAMRLLDMQPAPLILGFVLGPLMEENFRRAMLIARGDFLVFFERPISGTLMTLSLILVAYVVYSSFNQGRIRRKAAKAA